MTADWEAYELEEDDIAETITRRDYEEGVAAVRGLLIGLALTAAAVGAFLASGLVLLAVITR